MVRTPQDAIKLFEACRLGQLPRVQRRLSEKERQSIQSGSVFVWDEREAGMRRWTDGKSWSASRVQGSFLSYREMEGKRGGGFGNARRGAGKTPDSGRGSEGSDEGEPDGYRYKADGLMKQSFSITTSAGQHLHLISYYTRPHVGQEDLQVPSLDPQLRHIVPPKGLYPESSLPETPVPAMTRTPMQPQYAQAQQHPPPVDTQAYPPYSQQGHRPYHWTPLSPMTTPPYNHHYTTSASYPQSQQSPLPPPPGSNYAPPPPPLPPSSAQLYMNSAAYERPTLLPPVAPSSHFGHAESRTSPRSAHAAAAYAQAQPQHPSADARLPPPPPSTRGPLPALAGVPPSRGQSISPPRSSHSDAATQQAPRPAAAGTVASGGKPAVLSMSALLHPPGPSESGSANPAHGSNSPSSSPRGAACDTPQQLPGIHTFREDRRTLKALDGRFSV